jgi:DNA-binding response OmpR family regulator
MLQIRDKALIVGMNDFVAKPFNPNELYVKMLSLLTN